MTTLKQWHEYIEKHPDGYGLTQFRLALQRYRLIANPTMRMEHKAGDKMFVDYTGSKLWIYPHGESPRQVEVFVAILGCSLLTYVEAVAGQSKEDFISACENTFYYYGGVPQAIVSDNLKAAVIKPGRYESLLNEEFERFAEHYGVTVVPARARKPRDKSHVENAVKLTYKDIFTHIESLHCPDLKSLNATIRLREDIHFYSVPYIYINKKLKISYTASDVFIYDGYTCVATHVRDRKEFRHTFPEHLSPKH